MNTPVLSVHAIAGTMSATEVFIFYCDSRTGAECIRRQLLGGPPKALRSAGVDRIEKGTLCLLCNFKEKALLGPFRASGRAKMNIEQKAWGGKFPMQCKITVPEWYSAETMFCAYNG